MQRFRALCERAPAVCIAATAESGGEAVAKFRAGSFDAVVLAGDLDGCHGVRVAGALARERWTPSVILVPPEEEGQVRAHLEQRGLDGVTVLGNDMVDADPYLAAAELRQAFRPRGPGLGAGTIAFEPAFRPRSTLESLATDGHDAVLLLGSAGTPHMLPRWLPAAAERVHPLIIAVHHNPALSRSFCDWIEELVGQPAHRPELDGDGYELGDVNVVPAAEESPKDTLLPNLERVLDRVMELGRKPVVCVGSGMGFEGIDALRRVVKAGGTIVALDPAACTAPSMPQLVIASGLASHVVDVREFGWVLSRGASGLGEALATAV